MTSSADDKSAGEGSTVVINGVSQPRKRSKVSRACDSCRRKKIKCNGEYSSSLQKVTKICDNCVKNNDECTFSRVPLKRGPSKGYIREPDDKLEGTPRKISIDQSSQQPLPFPPGHVSRSSVSGTQSGQSPIILPPLVGIQSKVGMLPPSMQKLNGDSRPSSPSPNGVLNYKNDLPHPVTQSLADKTNSPPIQGPFWKVPYEMPSEAGITSGTNSNRRKSSVDSVSSISTNGSRLSRLPNLKTTNSISSSEVGGISDSESEEYYSSRSRRPSSQSLSPRNSISSLSSLNNRLGKDLTLNSPQYLSPQNQQKPIQFPQIHQMGGQQHIQSTNFPIYYYATSAPNVSVSIENNIKMYYSKFHENLPILPLNETSMYRKIESLGESNKILLEIFNHSLGNLNNFKNLTLNDSISLITRIQTLYPFNESNIRVDDNVLFFFFSSLLILNYSIILNGNYYSLGISITMGIFNDFKVLENFVDLIKKRQIPKDFDSLELYLPKLYYCLVLFDNLNALSFGVQKLLTNPLLNVFEENVELFVPTDQITGGLLNLKYTSVLNDFIQERDRLRLKSSPPGDVRRNLIDSNWVSFSSHFMSLISQKLEVTEHILEIKNFLKTTEERKSIPYDDEEFIEALGDYHLKSIRLVRKISNAILKFANYISTSSNSNELTNPYLNISFGQLFKLIKLCKLFVDSLVSFNPLNTEISNRCVKVNNDLSISFNLLNLNQNNLNLGSESISLIRQKVEQYNLSFSMPQMTQSMENQDLKMKANIWKNDFLNVIFPFFEREAYEGWY